MRDLVSSLNPSQNLSSGKVSGRAGPLSDISVDYWRCLGSYANTVSLLLTRKYHFYSCAAYSEMCLRLIWLVFNLCLGKRAGISSQPWSSRLVRLRINRPKDSFIANRAIPDSSQITIPYILCFRVSRN